MYSQFQGLGNPQPGIDCQFQGLGNPKPGIDYRFPGLGNPKPDILSDRAGYVEFDPTATCLVWVSNPILPFLESDALPTELPGEILLNN